jgi:hypothetical protein
MNNPYTGGCACGAIRYACNAEPMFAWICHCRECQRATGGGGMVNVVFNDSSVRYTLGHPKFHDSTGTRGQKTHRGFCPECGSPIAAKADMFPHIHGLTAGSLDEPQRINLIANIWTSSAQPWDHLAPSLAQIETTPTAAELGELMKRDQAR